MVAQLVNLARLFLIFRTVEDVAGLTLNLGRCVLIPVAVLATTHIFDMVKLWLIRRISE